MSDLFSRLTESVFTRLGEDAFLRGVACQIEISHGVEITTGGDYSNVVSHRSVANIHYKDLPKPKTGDQITIANKNYTLDMLLRDDGYSARWVLT